MNIIFICYPNLFKCYSKFERKVFNILKNLDLKATTILYTDDSNNFINEFAKKNLLELKQYSNWFMIEKELTHAIIFDDGEEFPETTQAIRAKGIPLRVIKIKITRVINIKIDTKYGKQKSNTKYEYIGRGSYWGNPHSMYEKGENRDEVIRKFKYDFDFNKFPYIEKSEVYKLAGKRLGCFCKPAKCHGDILAEYLNAWDDGE